MRRIRMWGWVFAAAWVLAAAGCWPNRVAVSPDGRTMYFSLNPQGGVKTEDGSNIYALDVETAELRQLTDSPAMEGWCDLSEDGKDLLHSAAVEGGFWVQVLDLEEDVSAPLTGALTYLYPRFVPGNRVLAVTGKDFKDDKGGWVLIGEEGPVPLFNEYAVLGGEVAVTETRFACAVKRELALPEGGDDAPSRLEVAVYVVALSEPVEEKEGKEVEKEEGSAPPKDEQGAEEPAPKVKATCVGQWEVKEDQKEAQPVDLAFSPGGKRLVAAVFGAGASDEHTGFFELDSAGEAEPKPLFEAKKAFYPQWTPDSLGLVYLRLCPEDDKWREVMLWRPEAEEPRVLARLPGEMGEAYTTWRWMEDGRLRIYHLSDEGVRIVETATDGPSPAVGLRPAGGSDAKAKRLPGENLVVLKRLADFGRAMDKMPDLSEGEWPEPFAERMKVVADYWDLDKHIENAPESVQRAAKEAEEAAERWEPVPAIPELPKKEAEPEPSAEKVKAVAEPLK